MHNLIHGLWVLGQGEPLVSSCPATGRAVWVGASASCLQVDQAAISAKRAFQIWNRQTLEQRIALVHRFKSALLSQTDAMAKTISQEVGKPLWEAKTEMASMAAKIDISIQAYNERTGTQQQAMADGERLLTHRPHGVLVVLGPYNFPGHLPNGHIVPALLAGNTVLFKPSEYAPGVACLMARCWQEAGLPDGVVNVLQGGASVGRALVDHPAIDGVLMTGSYTTGLALSNRLANQPHKILALEMGGNNPLVVWDVQDISTAVSIIVQSAFLSAGQRCTCARRLIVPSGPQGDTIIESLVAALAGVHVGVWDANPEPFMGPVVSHVMAERLLDQQKQLLTLGAKPLQPMRSLNYGTGFLSPGLLDMTGVTHVTDEEIFGPLLQIYRTNSFDEAIAVANQTSYGLAAGLLCEDPQKWRQFWHEIKAGVISWNKPTTGAASAAPFGGVGRSGNHRPSAYYAADYCAYPVSALISSRLSAFKSNLPGLG
jgi:succinylglutamic semialdehyde dehydrogenase